LHAALYGAVVALGGCTPAPTSSHADRVGRNQPLASVRNDASDGAAVAVHIAGDAGDAGGAAGAGWRELLGVPFVNDLIAQNDRVIFATEDGLIAIDDNGDLRRLGPPASALGLTIDEAGIYLVRFDGQGFALEHFARLDDSVPKRRDVMTTLGTVTFPNAARRRTSGLLRFFLASDPAYVYVGIGRDRAARITKRSGAVEDLSSIADARAAGSYPPIAGTLVSANGGAFAARDTTPHHDGGGVYRLGVHPTRISEESCSELAAAPDGVLFCSSAFGGVASLTSPPRALGWKNAQTYRLTASATHVCVADGDYKDRSFADVRCVSRTASAVDGGAPALVGRLPFVPCKLVATTARLYAQHCASGHIHASDL
jgi:hypothetical protein